MNNQQPYRTKLKYDVVTGLTNIIEMLIVKFPAKDDVEKMHYANLNEILIKAKQKMIIYKAEYSFSLTPAQAFAMRLMADKYIIDYTSYLGNKLHQLSNQIHQQYS